jgi:hypothetical protein
MATSHIDDPYSDEAIARAAQQIFAAHNDVISISVDCYRKLCSMLANKEYSPGTPDEVVFALSARVLDLTATTLRSLGHGSVPSAKILTRAVLEAIYKIVAVQVNADNIDQFFHDDAASQLGKNKKILEYKKAKKSKSVAKGVEKKIDALAAQKVQKIDPAEWATRAGMQDFHLLFYPWLSSDVHGNASALDHYFNPEADDVLEVGPGDLDLRLTSVALARCLLVLVRALDTSHHETAAWRLVIEQRLMTIEAQ